MIRCSSCGAPIIWATTQSGKKMPLDAEPRDDGNVLLHDGRATYIKKAEQLDLVDAGRRYVSHFATCPNAAKHRKKETK